MFRDRLAAIADRNPGTQLVALVADDGIPVEIHGELEGTDIEELSAELTAHMRTIADSHEGLNMGAVRLLSLVSDERVVQLGEAGDGYYLVLVLSRGANQGRARFELRRAPLDFADDLA